MNPKAKVTVVIHLVDWSGFLNIAQVRLGRRPQFAQIGLGGIEQPRHGGLDPGDERRLRHFERGLGGLLAGTGPSRCSRTCFFAMNVRSR